MTLIRLNFLTALMLISFNKLFAQDILYKQDGSKIETKVLEVSPMEIKYKLFKNQEGPIYSIAKNDVLMIVYQNGDNEVFTKKEDQASKSKRRFSSNDSLLKDFSRNFIAINLVDIFSINLSFSYEYIVKSGYVGFKIPVSFGLNGSNGIDYYNEPYNYGYSNSNGYFNFNGNKIYSSGLNINIYPFGQRKLSYFVGPAIEFGSFYYMTSNYDNGIYFSQNYNPYYPINPLHKGQHLALLVNNGIVFQPTKHFSYSLNFGLGFKKDETHFTGEPIQVKANGEVNIGYRF